MWACSVTMMKYVILLVQCSEHSRWQQARSSDQQRNQPKYQRGHHRQGAHAQIRVQQTGVWIDCRDDRSRPRQRHHHGNRCLVPTKSSTARRRLRRCRPPRKRYNWTPWTSGAPSTTADLASQRTLDATTTKEEMKAGYLKYLQKHARGCRHSRRQQCPWTVSSCSKTSRKSSTTASVTSSSIA